VDSAQAPDDVRLLIDECLSAVLARLARERGHHEATHVRWIGKAGWPDHRLMQIIRDGDWTFVTRNAADFRGPASAPGTKGQYAGVEVHAGLVCLNGPTSMGLAAQLELFATVLDELDRDPDTVNQVIEAMLRGDKTALLRFAMPP
jgi:hypothetical protein